MIRAVLATLMLAAACVHRPCVVTIPRTEGVTRTEFTRRWDAAENAARGCDRETRQRLREERRAAWIRWQAQRIGGMPS